MNEMHLAKLIHEIEMICLLDFRSIEFQIDHSHEIRRLLSSATYRLSNVRIFSNEAAQIKSLKSRLGRIDYLVNLLPRLYELEGKLIV